MNDGSTPEGELPEGQEPPPRGVRAMSLVRWALVGVMALVAVAAIGHRAGWFRGGNAPAAHATTYYCPMHPDVQQDHPGDCPICSMTLVPKPEAGAAAPPRTDGMPTGLAPVTLSPERVQLMGMRTAQARRAVLAPTVRTVGTVTPSERGLADVQVRFAGWIESLDVAQTGQKVRKGQILARIYSPELLTAQQEYLSAQRWTKSPDGGRTSALSAGLGKDARQRLELYGVGAEEIAELERTGEPVRAIAVRSPVNGHVLEKGAIQGQRVEPGTTLFQLADLSTVWVVAEVYEHELQRIAVGQPASVTLAAYPGEAFVGKVAFIQPTLSADTRTLRVRVELANPELRLKPGMYGDVTIEVAGGEGVVVPADAVVDTGAAQYVFLVRDAGTFEPRRVTLGPRSGDDVQILAGVADGDTVVTTANFLLDSESRLRAAIEAAPAKDACDTEIDAQKFPDKRAQCVACRAHRGMGTMEDDCRAQIPRPWK